MVISTLESDHQSSYTYPLFDTVRYKVDQNLRGKIVKIQRKLKFNDRPQLISTDNASFIFKTKPYFKAEKKVLKLLRNTYSDCLKASVEHKCRTIPFSTIVCGTSGLKATDAARYIRLILEDFNQTKRAKELDEIRMFIYDPKYI